MKPDDGVQYHGRVSERNGERPPEDTPGLHLKLSRDMSQQPVARFEGRERSGGGGEGALSSHVVYLGTGYI